jgi:hypothetical protein
MTTTNNCQGTVHTTTCDHTAAPALKKRDCEKVRTDVRDAEKSMGWLQWIATKDDSWRNPWVIFAKFNECKRLPEQLDAGAYTQLRDRLQAYDRGELKLSGEDAMELRRTVNLVQMRYDNVPSPYHTMPSNYISPAEQEVYDRFGNNMTMALVPATIPGIAGTRAMGGTEAQARAGGELSAMAFGFMGARFMQKHGLLRQKIEPAPTGAQQTTSQPVRKPGIVVLAAKPKHLPGSRAAIDEIKDLPQFKGRTKAEIEAHLQQEGYTRVPSNDGTGSVWTKPGSDGSTAAVRLDPGHTNIPSTYSGAQPHVHKELVPTSSVVNGNYNPRSTSGYFDDLANTTRRTDFDLNHTPILWP